MLRFLLIALTTTTSTIALSTQVRADAPRVVTDIAPVHGLVSMVMQGVGDPSLLIEPGSSPHTNAMRPSAAAALQEADIVFWTGEELTPWLHDPIETLAANAAHVPLLDLESTRRLAFRETKAFGSHDEHSDDDHGHEEAAHDDHGHEEAAHDDHGHEEAAHEDHGHEEAAHDDHGHEEAAHDDHGHDDHGHSGTDPHAWLDPRNAQAWLSDIAAVLSETDPENAATYAANAETAARQITEAAQDAQTMLTPLQDRSFIVFHDAYQYFETGFGLRASGALSLSDAVPPSPSHVADIQSEIREDDITCVFSEPQYSEGLVRTVIDGTAARTAELDPLGTDLTPGATLYPALIRDMATRFQTCLQ